MRKDFIEFMNICKEGIAKGELQISKPLTDFDYAVQYAIGQIGDRKGYPLNTTTEEIAIEIGNFAPELLNETYKAESEGEI